MENKKRVLIVEDEPSICNALCDKLAHEGFAALEAKNGKEGLKVALREHPDLILLDIILPVMDGLTLLKKLRQDSWGMNAKIIILTNLSDDEKVAEAIQNGAFEYLVKSDWKIEDVVKKITEMIGR